MDEDILITFVIDVEYEPRLEKYSDKVKYYQKVDILFDKTIKEKIKHNNLKAFFIYCQKKNIDEDLDKKRLYITYETDIYNANHLVYLIQKNTFLIFDALIKNNKYFKITSMKLMNESLHYDYYKDYWNSFLFLSDSPRTNL